MLSYMLPAGDKPPPGDTTQNCSRLQQQQQQQQQTRVQNHGDEIKHNGSATVEAPKSIANGNKSISCNNYETTSTLSTISTTTTIMTTTITAPVKSEENTLQDNQIHSIELSESPKHNGTRKSTLHTSKVPKDDSLHSINSDASTVGSDRKSKIANGGKHANLKRVSFGSSKGSMVETLVYETPVQEEPENNHFHEQNGQLPITPVPDTDEGREKVRVAFLGPQPHPATPGVLLLEPLVSIPDNYIDAMSAAPAELLATHTEHTSPAYHAQISTDSGWDNPFRPDGDLSREADEIVELIKGGKPITPTPGQTAPPLPGCIDKPSGDEHDSSTSPLLNNSSSAQTTNQGNGNLYNWNTETSASPKKPMKSSTATVEVGRVTAQGPGDASQIEHVTLKKKPKCKCCVLQ